MRTSCIQEPANAYFYTVKSFYLDLCDGDKCAAALLAIYKHRYEGLIDNSQGPWQVMSIKHARTWLLDSFSLNKIRQANELLEQNGFIQTRTPKVGPKENAPTEVLFMPKNIQLALNIWATKNAENSTSKMKQGYFKNEVGGTSKMKQGYFKNGEKEDVLEYKEEDTLPNGKVNSSNKFDEGDFEQIEDVLEVAQPKNQNEEEKERKKVARKKERKDYDKEARLEDAKEVLTLLSERSGRTYAAYRGPKPTNALEMASKAILSAYKDFVLPLYAEPLKNGSMSLTDAKAMAKDSVLALVAFKADEWKGTSTAEFLRPETLFGSRNFLKYMEQMQACNGQAPERQPTNLSSHEQKLNEMRANNIRANMPDAKEDYIF